MKQRNCRRQRKENAGGRPDEVCRCSTAPTVLVAVAGDCPRVKHGRCLRHAASAFAASITVAVAMSTMASPTAFSNGCHQDVWLVSP